MALDLLFARFQVLWHSDFNDFFGTAFGFEIPFHSIQMFVLDILQKIDR